jgi:hypothetical protein
MRRHAAHWTRWLQWAVAASILAALGLGAFVPVSAKPKDTLYITLGDLRSRAAELREIARNARAERLTQTYVHAQAKQLVPRIASLRDDLVKAESERTSASAGMARDLSDRLLGFAQALASREPPYVAPTLENEVDKLITALMPLERRAKP